MAGDKGHGLIQVTIDGKPSNLSAATIDLMQTASDRAVERSTKVIARKARKHIASILGRRAGFLITSTVFSNTAGKSAGFIYSRWQRRQGSGDGQVEFAAAAHIGSRGGANDSNYSDVLAAHEYGATIRPSNGRYLYVPLVGGRLKRRERRSFQNRLKNKTELVPLKSTSQNGKRFLVVDKGVRGKINRPIALLVERVTIPKRLNIQAIFNEADDVLSAALASAFTREGQRRAN